MASFPSNHDKNGSGGDGGVGRANGELRGSMGSSNDSNRPSLENVAGWAESSFARSLFFTDAQINGDEKISSTSPSSSRRPSQTDVPASRNRSSFHNRPKRMPSLQLVSNLPTLDESDHPPPTARLNAASIGSTQSINASNSIGPGTLEREESWVADVMKFEASVAESGGQMSVNVMDLLGSSTASLSLGRSLDTTTSTRTISQHGPTTLSPAKTLSSPPPTPSRQSIQRTGETSSSLLSGPATDASKGTSSFAVLNMLGGSLGEVREQYKIMAQHEAAARVKASTGFDVDEIEKRRKLDADGTSDGNNGKNSDAKPSNRKRAAIKRTHAPTLREGRAMSTPRPMTLSSLPPRRSHLQHFASFGLSNTIVGIGIEDTSSKKPPIDTTGGGSSSSGSSSRREEKDEAQNTRWMRESEQCAGVLVVDGSSFHLDDNEHLVRCLGCQGRMRVKRVSNLVICPFCQTVSPTTSME